MPLRPLRTREDLEEALGAPLFLLLKHSPLCPVSHDARREAEAWHGEHPDAPAGWLDVVAQRPWSREVELRTGVEHASPQALLLVRGEAAWSASHDEITREALAAAVRSRGG